MLCTMNKAYGSTGSPPPDKADRVQLVMSVDKVGRH